MAPNTGRSALSTAAMRTRSPRLRNGVRDRPYFSFSIVRASAMQAKPIPSRRIGTDEDMQGVAIYLASRAGDYVVGETIAVDGGVALASFGGL